MIKLPLDFTADALRQATSPTAPKGLTTGYEKIKEFILQYVNTRSNKNDNKVRCYADADAETLGKLVAEGFRVESTREAGHNHPLIQISW